MLTGTCHCGAASWTLATRPDSVTACNCTICRRYGALWAYGTIGGDVTVAGDTTPYRRADGTQLEFHFCRHCGSAMFNMAREPGPDGRRWVAVNIRMCDPAPLFDLPIDHFDGHASWEDLPRDGRTVRDLWF